MPGRVLTTPEADADLAAAFDWYEAHRAGLGSDFLAEVAAVFSYLEGFPEAHAAVRGETRRTMVHRFPYGVFYIIDRDSVAVTGVLQDSDDPFRGRKIRRARRQLTQLCPAIGLASCHGLARRTDRGSMN